MFTIDLMFKLRIKLLRNYKRRKGVNEENEEEKKHKNGWGPSKATIPILILLQATNLARHPHQQKNYKDINVSDSTKTNLTKNKENSINHNHHNTLTTSTLIVLFFKMLNFSKKQNFVKENKEPFGIFKNHYFLTWDLQN